MCVAYITHTHVQNIHCTNFFIILCYALFHLMVYSIVLTINFLYLNLIEYIKFIFLQLLL